MTWSISSPIVQSTIPRKLNSASRCDLFGNQIVGKVPCPVAGRAALPGAGVCSRGTMRCFLSAIVFNAVSVTRVGSPFLSPGARRRV